MGNKMNILESVCQWLFSPAFCYVNTLIREQCSYIYSKSWTIDKGKRHAGPGPFDLPMTTLCVPFRPRATNMNKNLFAYNLAFKITTSKILPIVVKNKANGMNSWFFFFFFRQTWISFTTGHTQVLSTYELIRWA